MIVHVVDGTYELFWHFYGLRRFNKGKDRPFGAVIGVLQTLLQMIEQGVIHVGVETDHIIESGSVHHDTARAKKLPTMGYEQSLVAQGALVSYGSANVHRPCCGGLPRRAIRPPHG